MFLESFKITKLDGLGHYGHFWEEILIADC